MEINRSEEHDLKTIYIAPLLVCVQMCDMDRNLMGSFGRIMRV